MRRDRLVVWLGGDQIGDLVREGRGFGIRFRKRPDVRRTLTVAADGAAEAWTPSFTRAWFDGLLPEEARRSAAEATHGVDRGDTFGLLAAIGWECAGAVSVLPEGRSPASGSYRPLRDEDVWERLDALPGHLAEDDRAVRLSLGGAQEKLLLAHIEGQWNLPIDGAVTTHILKPEPPAYPGLAVGEAWALAAASAATTTARAEHRTLDGHRPTVVIERYDRRVTDGTVERTHQEDGCQALGLPPEQKYPRGVGPRVASLGRVASLLVARAEEPMTELRRLLEQTVANIVLLNTDAHAKNISIVHSGIRTVTLSPLYDIAPTLYFLPTQPSAALPVGGKWRISEIERRHLLAEARAWGIPESEARATVTRTIDAILAGTIAASERYPSAPVAMRAAVDAQARRILASDW